jgi:hypothetical protein
MLSDLIAAIREAVTGFRRRRAVKANIRRMADRLPF